MKLCSMWGVQEQKCSFKSSLWQTPMNACGPCSIFVLWASSVTWTNAWGPWGAEMQFIRMRHILSGTALNGNHGHDRSQMLWCRQIRIVTCHQASLAYQLACLFCCAYHTYGTNSQSGIRSLSSYTCSQLQQKALKKHRDIYRLWMVHAVVY